MTLDLIIRGGTVVDGTGARMKRADVGVRDGVITAVGVVDEPATRILQAEGKVVTPGFVDVHTHYDAQVHWDNRLAQSSLHGVTTAIAGNCGFSIAPMSPDAIDYIQTMFGRVEGMSVNSLKAGIDWGRWETFGEWLALLESRLPINMGFLVGHSTVRRCAMGDRAVGGKPTADDLKKMEDLVRSALSAGALGFSSSNASTDVDGNGDPVPSRWADDAELLALCGVVSDYPGTTLEYLPGRWPAEAEVARRMTAMSIASERMVNWNLMSIDTSRAAELEESLSASTVARDRGARFLGLALPVPLQLHLSFAQGCILEALPGWESVSSGRSTGERIQAFEDPAVRRKLKECLEERALWVFDYRKYLIEVIDAPSNRLFLGRTVEDIAAEENQDPFDKFIEIVVADRLRTRFATPKHGDDPASWSLRIETCLDPRVIVGGSDTGAHGADLDSFNLFTDFVGTSVRERRLLSLEDAVRRITMDPAREFGLVRRGQVREGFYGDLLVFDPLEIKPGPSEFRADLPGGGERLYAEARGMSHVIVNGTCVIDDGEFTDEVPGTLLRSGRDTTTVRV